MLFWCGVNELTIWEIGEYEIVKSTKVSNRILSYIQQQRKVDELAFFSIRNVITILLHIYLNVFYGIKYSFIF